MCMVTGVISARNGGARGGLRVNAYKARLKITRPGRGP
jgi:hypothetical protein